jgi:hypothetical protein
MQIVCFPFLVESDLTPSAFPISTVIIAVAVVVTVTLALITVTLIVALVSRNRRSTIDLRKERGGDELLTLHRSAPVHSVVQLNPVPLAMEEPPHEYEDINVVLGRLPTRPPEFNTTTPRSGTEVEIGTTPCAAYVATTKPVHLETEYDEIIPRSGAKEEVSTVPFPATTGVIHMETQYEMIPEVVPTSGTNNEEVSTTPCPAYATTTGMIHLETEMTRDESK